MKRFKSPWQVQRFLSSHDQIANLFSRRPYDDTAAKFRTACSQAFTTWSDDREQRGLGKPETCHFLGFTFICSKFRKAQLQIQRKTWRDRMMAKLLELKEEMRRRMHGPISEQGNG